MTLDSWGSLLLRVIVTVYMIYGGIVEIKIIIHYFRGLYPRRYVLLAIIGLVFNIYGFIWMWNL